MSKAITYLQAQLARFDKKLHTAKDSYTWGRDIHLNEDVQVSDEYTAYILGQFSTQGTQSVDGKPWIDSGGKSTTIPAVEFSGTPEMTPLRGLARKIAYTEEEVNKWVRFGVQAPATKLNGLHESYQKETDEMIYLGDKDVRAEGLLNNSKVLNMQAEDIGGGVTNWEQKTPKQILRDVNKLIEMSYQNSGNQIMPNKIILPPSKLMLLASTMVSDNAEKTILRFIEESNAAAITGTKVTFVSTPRNQKLGVGGGERMFAYNQDIDNVRFALIPIRRRHSLYQELQYVTFYSWVYGEVEFVRPDCGAYMDDI